MSLFLLLMCFFFIFYDFLIFCLLMLFTIYVVLTFSLSYNNGFLYLDFLSFMMLFISLLVFLYCFFSMFFSLKMDLLFKFMMLFVILSFLVDDGFLFYLFFEISFVLMFSFLLGWGVTMERVQASYYMLFYTMVFSLPFLVLLVDMMFFYSLGYFSFYGMVGVWDYFWLFMMFLFIVKLPLFGFHLWLPKAHVEAPVVGSMLLAGVLLKLGGYGLIRFLPLLSEVGFVFSKFSSLFFYVGLMGGLLMNLVCLRQVDLKILIAYSSIVHMSLMYMGLFSFSEVGLMGSLYMMVAHGLVSPALFFLMNEIYLKIYSRSLFVLKGGVLFSMLFVFLWFLGCSLNFGFPPFMSFFSEVFIFSSLSFLSFLDFVFLVLFSFFTGVYCMMMFVTVSHGVYFLGSIVFMSFKSIMLLFLHYYYVLLFPFLFFIF